MQVERTDCPLRISCARWSYELLASLPVSLVIYKLSTTAPFHRGRFGFGGL